MSRGIYNPKPDNGGKVVSGGHWLTASGRASGLLSCSFCPSSFGHSGRLLLTRSCVVLQRFSRFEAVLPPWTCLWVCTCCGSALAALDLSLCSGHLGRIGPCSPYFGCKGSQKVFRQCSICSSHLVPVSLATLFVSWVVPQTRPLYEV
eukprot:EG_transcript_8304